MSGSNTLKINKDFGITIPSRIAKRCGLQKGMELFLMEKDGIMILLPKKDDTIWGKLRGAIAELRKSVKAHGGVTGAEIREAIYKIRNA